jgi:hypothetical protein
MYTLMINDVITPLIVIILVDESVKYLCILKQRFDVPPQYWVSNIASNICYKYEFCYIRP